MILEYGNVRNDAEYYEARYFRIKIFGDEGKKQWNLELIHEQGS